MLSKIGTIALVIAAGMLAACGGSGDDEKGPLGSADNAVQAVPNPSNTRIPPTEQPPGEVAATPSQGRPKTAASTRTQQGTKDPGLARARAKAKADAQSAGGEAGHPKTARRQKALAPSAARPCSLVTKAQARAIIGVPIVEPLQAPQGPTCIYRTTSGKRFITLAVQTVRFAQLRRQIRQIRRVDVSGQTAYCATHGRPMLYLPLSGTRVLSVSAPCALATRFAAKAAPHL